MQNFQTDGRLGWRLWGKNGTKYSWVILRFHVFVFYVTVWRGAGYLMTVIRLVYYCFGMYWFLLDFFLVFILLKNLLVTSTNMATDSFWLVLSYS